MAAVFCCTLGLTVARFPHGRRFLLILGFRVWGCYVSTGQLFSFDFVSRSFRAYSLIVPVELYF